MLSPTTAVSSLTCGILLLCLGAAPAQAQDRSVEIEAKPLPGQVDLLQGTAIQLGGKPKEDAAAPASYRWEILEGEGGELYNEDAAEAIFQAPKIETDVELFVLQLTASYEGEDPAKVQLFVRVHRDISEQQQRQAKKAQKQARKQAKRQRRGTGNVYVQHHGPYPPWGVGFYWGWGWPAFYPIYVPIVIPGPGDIWGPGDGEWNPPIAVPYDELVATFPEDIAEQYLPQDYAEMESIGMPGAYDEAFYPDAYADAVPEVFMEPMPGGFDDPGLGGMDYGGFDTMDMGGFDEPMFDGGFDADPFGW